MNGKLYLIPALLGDCSAERVLPPYIQHIVNTITHYIVENERTARRFLLKIGYKHSIDNTTFYILNKHTKMEEFDTFLYPVMEGKTIGLLSEAGVPCVADPGNAIVSLAHAKDIAVIPLIGPSSILLALMASGLNGQNFAFVGYLPINRNERIKRIKYLENISAKENQTQICIETPYRNQNLLEDIITSCQAGTKLCIACNITLKEEYIKTKTIHEWKNKLPDLHKKPTVFLLQKKY